MGCSSAPSRDRCYTGSRTDAFFNRNLGCPTHAPTSRSTDASFRLPAVRLFRRDGRFGRLISILPIRGSSRTCACAETRRLRQRGAAPRRRRTRARRARARRQTARRGHYRIEPDGGLVLADVPDAFTLEVETRIVPETNTALSGLYMSGGNFCTQCEAEGFRRITYFLDRPDVMARYTPTIAPRRRASRCCCRTATPSSAGDPADGRHWARWVDPFPKPSYLFALVAGDLVAVEDSFMTRSGRKVALRSRCAAATRTNAATQWIR